MNYFSRISLERHAVTPETLGQLACGEPYRDHQRLWKLFDAEHRQFLFRYQSVDGLPRYFVVSSRPPRDDARFWQVETKDYRPQLVSGQTLGFNLLANPVVTHKDEQGRRHRHDVVMNRKHTFDPGQRPVMNDLVRDAGLLWLDAQARRRGFRFDPDQVLVHGYRQHRLHRTGRQPIQFSTLEFEGSLTVTEPAAFTDALTNGIGPAKAFGCGLLLVRKH